jgi:preprotein translocase subunit SecG
MSLQIERKDKLRQVSRLNRLVFGVAVLWLAASLLLVLSAGSSQTHQKYDHKNDRTHRNAHHQLFASVTHQGAAGAWHLVARGRT